MDTCQVRGCERTVSKAGFTFCIDHWRAERAGRVMRCAACGQWHEDAGPRCGPCAAAGANGEEGEGETAGGHYSSTRLGKQFGLSSVKVNLILAELGWIERYVKGWVPTDRGNAQGAEVREMRNGIPFVVWPESILKNTALLSSIGEQTGGRPTAAGSAPADLTATKPAAPTKADPPKSPADDFRQKFPATFRTQDGHMVRSRAEVLIDNWLYMQGLVHAYERRLPIEEECYCDFYLPGGRGVYIEFWGLESDPKYRDRMAAKQAIYAKHGLRLIELGDAEIERLDDVLPRLLLRFGIESA